MSDANERPVGNSEVSLRVNDSSTGAGDNFREGLGRRKPASHTKPQKAILEIIVRRRLNTVQLFERPKLAGRKHICRHKDKAKVGHNLTIGWGVQRAKYGWLGGWFPCGARPLIGVGVDPPPPTRCQLLENWFDTRTKKKVATELTPETWSRGRQSQ